MEERLAWVRKVIEAQQTSDDVEEIVRAIKNDLSPEDIVVMTPRGDSISLPVGSTVIDFAYRIHTEIGHKTIGGKVNGKMVPLDYPLQTGQICEVLTSKDPNKGPNRHGWVLSRPTRQSPRFPGSRKSAEKRTLLPARRIWSRSSSAVTSICRKRNGAHSWQMI